MMFVGVCGSQPRGLCVKLSAGDRQQFRSDFLFHFQHTCNHVARDLVSQWYYVVNGR